jgi:hypothetical protein
VFNALNGHGFWILAVGFFVSFYAHAARLNVTSASPGAYKIYRIVKEEPIQMESFRGGIFNEAIKMEPGRYLLLTDCSSTLVDLKPNADLTIRIKEIHFVKPLLSESSQKFVIRCEQSEITGIKNKLFDTFLLHVFDFETTDILVGLKALSLQSEGDSVSIDLGAVTVGNKKDKNQHYFISLQEQKSILTEAQVLGSSLLLTPGTYEVSLNGSTQKIDLSAAQHVHIEPGILRLQAPVQVDMQDITERLGYPVLAVINDKHRVEYNQDIPMIEGTHHIKMHNAEYSHSVELKPGTLLKLSPHALEVSLGCNQWERSCIGRKKIFLYKKDSMYPFTFGYSDVPILYLDEDVWISIEGLSHVKRKIDDKNVYQKLRTGLVEFLPDVLYQPNLITDLLRVEAAALPFEGRSLDFAIQQTSIKHLIEGSYILAEYYSHGDDKRTSRKTLFTVKPDKRIQLSFRAFLSSKDFNQYQQKQEAEIKRKSELESTRMSRGSFPPQKFQSW